MKKFFTLVAVALLGGSAIASAKAVTLQVCNSKAEEVAKSCETELTRDDAGNYVIANFLNSGSPLAFTFDASVEVGKKTVLEIKSNIDDDNPYLYLLDSNEDDMECTITPLESDSPLTIYSPYVYYGASYTYVRHQNKEEDGTDYFARISISGWDENDTSVGYYYVYMYFDEIAFEGGNGEENPGDDTPSVVVQTINVTVDTDEATYYPDYDDEETYSEKSLKSFDAQLEITEDGVYTLKNIFGSDYSISYKIGSFNPKNKAAITYTGNIYADKGYENYPYFLTPDGDCMTISVEEESGEKMTVEYLTGYQSSSYAYVYKCSDEELAAGYNQYYVYMYLYGYVGDSGELDMNISFGYDLPTSGVAGVQVNENAPVEYYNLQGVKVANPSNGIFVRRQGGDVKKVVIK